MKFIKTYESFGDDADTMARYQLFGSDAVMSFYFNDEHITEPDKIKDLIEKYNQYYIESKSWAGDPPPTNFVDYFNKNYSEKGNATRKTWYPVVTLKIETPDYGSIIIGFSIKSKTVKLYNHDDLKDPSSKYDENVLEEMVDFIKKEIDKMGKTIDEAIEMLNLDVKNRVEWEWQE